MRVEPWPIGMATETVYTQFSGQDVEPQLGMKIGSRYFYGEMIATGYYNEDDEDGPLYSVVIFLAPLDRVPNVRNYLVAHFQMGKLFNITAYANLVEAVKAYADEYGMDI